MRKKIKMLSTLTLLAASLTLTGCVKEQEYDIESSNHVESSTQEEITSTHTHSFNIKNIDENYLVSEANENSGAIYKYSCSCGEAGSNTFTVGNAISTHTHSFNIKNIDDSCLASNATCKHASLYYYSCSCGELDENTFELGEPIKHSLGIDGICENCSADFNTIVDFAEVYNNQNVSGGTCIYTLQAYNGYAYLSFDLDSLCSIDHFNLEFDKDFCKNIKLYTGDNLIEYTTGSYIPDAYNGKSIYSSGQTILDDIYIVFTLKDSSITELPVNINSLYANVEHVTNVSYYGKYTYIDGNLYKQCSRCDEVMYFEPINITPYIYQNEMNFTINPTDGDYNNLEAYEIEITDACVYNVSSTNAWAKLISTDGTPETYNFLMPGKYILLMGNISASPSDITISFSTEQEASCAVAIGTYYLFKLDVPNDNSTYYLNLDLIGSDDDYVDSYIFDENYEMMDSSFKLFSYETTHYIYAVIYSYDDATYDLSISLAKHNGHIVDEFGRCVCGQITYEIYDKMLLFEGENYLYYTSSDCEVTLSTDGESTITCYKNGDLYQNGTNSITYLDTQSGDRIVVVITIEGNNQTLTYSQVYS